MGVIAAYVFPHPPIIVPAVGQGEEEPARKTIESCRAIAAELAEANADALVVCSPHAYLVPDGFFFTTASRLSGSMERFRAYDTMINAQVDLGLTDGIIDRATASGIRILGSAPQEVETFDHGTYVPLYFIAEAYALRDGVDVSKGLPNDYELPVKVVRMGMSQLSGQTHEQMGEIIADVASKQRKRVIFIASGDCAHRLLEEGPYGFHPDAVTLEEAIKHALGTNNLKEFFYISTQVRSNGGDCGTRSFQIMTGAVSGFAHTSELLSEEAPFGIGYCVAAIRPVEG